MHTKHALQLIAAIMLLAPLQLMAQWVQTNGPIGRGYVGKVQFADSVLLATTVSGVYRSTNFGVQWTATTLRSPNLGPLAARGNVAFAGSRDGDIFISSDYGNNWSASNVTSDGISALVYITASVLAGTDSGRVYRSTDNGQNWTALGYCVPGHRIIGFSSLGRVLFACTDVGVFRTTDMGSSWSSSGLASNTRAMAANGGVIFAGGGGSVFRSLDSGRTWSSVTSGLDYTFGVNALGISNGKVYVGTHEHQIGSVFAMSLYGAQWVRLASSRGGPINDLMFYQGVGVIATRDGGVWISFNDGSDWSDRNSGLVVSQVHDLVLHGSLLVAATGWYTTSGVSTSPDGGDNWTYPGLVFGMVVNAVAGIDTFLFAGTYYGCWRSTDNGASWNAAPQSPSGVIRRFGVSRGTLFARTDGGFVRSTNMAESWEDASTGLTEGGIGEPASIGDMLFIGSERGVFRSSNNGVSWTPMSLSGVDARQMIASGTHLVAWTPQGVRRSTDQGSSWTIVNTSLPAVSRFVRGGTALFAWTSGGLFYSTDSGTNWITTGELPPSTSVHPPAIAASSTDLFVGTHGAGVWRRSFLDMGIVPPFQVWAMTPGAFIESEDFNGTRSSPLNEFQIGVQISLYPVPTPALRDIAVEALLDGKPMRVHLNTPELVLDSNLDGMIDRFPALQPPNDGLIRFIVSTEEKFQENQLSKPFLFRITSVNSVPISFEYANSLSFLFAKHPREQRPFDVSVDAYEFKNYAGPTLLQFLQMIGCVGNPALGWQLFTLVSEYLGRCWGMVATTGGYFVYPDSKPYANEVHAYLKDDPVVQSRIDVAHLSQIGMRKFYDWDLNREYAALEGALGQQKLALLDLQTSTDYFSGKHVVLATKLTQFFREKTTYIDVYDSNYPDEIRSASYYYDSELFYYNGYVVFATVPQDAFSAAVASASFEPLCSIIVQEFVSSGSKVFGLACPAAMLAVDTQGRRIGQLDDGTLINEVLGASVRRAPASDAQGDSITTISVPKEEHYSVRIRGLGEGSMSFALTEVLDSTTISSIVVDSIHTTTSTVCEFNDSRPQEFLVDENGTGQFDTIKTVQSTTIVTGIQPAAASPKPIAYALYQCYPNPLNPSAAIRYALPHKSMVHLDVFSALGQHLVTLVDEDQGGGYHEVTFDGSNLPSGVYFYRLRAGDFVQTKKMLLLR